MWCRLYGQLIASGRYVGLGSRRMSDFSLLFNDNDVVLVPFEEDLSVDIMLATNVHPSHDPVAKAFTDLVKEQASVP